MAGGGLAPTCPPWETLVFLLLWHHQFGQVVSSLECAMYILVRISHGVPSSGVREWTAVAWQSLVRGVGSPCLQSLVRTSHGVRELGSSGVGSPCLQPPVERQVACSGGGPCGGDPPQGLSDAHFGIWCSISVAKNFSFLLQLVISQRGPSGQSI